MTKSKSSTEDLKPYFFQINTPESTVRRLPNFLEHIESMVCAVRVSNLPRIPTRFRGLSFRKPRPESEITQAIRDSLYRRPKLFQFGNRGITIHCASAKYNNEAKKLVVEMTDPYVHGILDGLTTYHICMEERSNLIRLGADPGVMVRFLSGYTRDEAIEISNLLNL